MRRVALVVLLVPLLTRCLPWDERLGMCRDAGLCTSPADAGEGSDAGTGTDAGGGTADGGDGGSAVMDAGVDAGTDAGVALLGVMPAPLLFGPVEQNTTKDLPLEITNTGDVALAAPTAEPENLAIFSVTNPCGALAPGGSCTMTVRYSPNSPTQQDDKLLTVRAPPAAPVVIHTVASSTPPGVRYEVLPQSLTFGPQQMLVPSATQQVVFHNLGVPSVALNDATLSDAGDFSIVSDGCRTTTQPTDGGCAVVVRFTPRTEGQLDAELRLKPASLADLVIPLHGTGFALTSLNVARTGISSDGGRIYSDDGGIDCPGRCIHQAPRGTVVTLRNGSVSPAAHFVEWDAGACSPGAATCDVTMQADASVASARFDPYNRVFVLTGNINGQFKASGNSCTAAAGALPTRAGTSWVYGVSDDGGTLVSALAGSRGWERTDGIPFADLPTDIINDRVLSPPLYSATGMLMNEALWTGIGASGATTPWNCADWTSVSTTEYGSQGYTQSEAGWSSGGSSQPCSTTAAVLCFEIGGRAPMVIAPRPTPSRLVFVSAGTVAGDTPQATANTLCNQEAGASNKFVAMRANVGGVNALVSFDGGTWYRPDNVRVFNQANEMSSQTKLQLAGISRQFDGGVLPALTRVWTGGDPASAYTAANTCNGWTSTSGSGEAGFTNYVNGSAFFGPLSCNQQAHLYCFEK